MKKKTQQSDKSLSIFDWIKQIITVKGDWSSFSEEDKSTYNIFLINKFLSMNRDYLEIVNFVQKLNIQDKEKSYLVYCSLIPTSHRTYFPYVKSSKESKSVELVGSISKYFECSNREATDYLDLLSTDEIKNILASIGTEDKQIIKLIKECK